MGRPTHAEQLVAEAESWCIEDPERRREKMARERIRHPKLIRDLLLDRLDTHLMDVLEVGGGPEPISDLLPFRSRVVVDPCTSDYSRYFACPDHVEARAEDMLFDAEFDLVIATNSLDHVEVPWLVMGNMRRAVRPGGYVAIMCAENNALTNPHPCHSINLTAREIHREFDRDYETVWELTYDKDGYRYGWVEYEGQRGQPAFALLLRDCRPHSLVN